MRSVVHCQHADLPEQGNTPRSIIVAVALKLVSTEAVTETFHEAYSVMGLVCPGLYSSPHVVGGGLYRSLEAILQVCRVQDVARIGNLLPPRTGVVS